MEQTQVEACKLDRRSLRTQRAIVEALAQELLSTGDLSRVTVTALCERADITRRTFYAHYRDIDDLVAHVEDVLLGELKCHVQHIAAANLDDLHKRIDLLKPCPGSVEMFAYIREHGTLYQSLLGRGGDPAFVRRLTNMIHEAVYERALTGLDMSAMASLFDYYLSFVISAEVGVLTQWLATGMQEDDETIARIMTLLAFVRPGDLYGKPININLPAYGLALLQMRGEARG